MSNFTKRIVIIIASKDFRDEEYFVSRGILEGAGFVVETASNKTSIAIGADGGEAQVDLLVLEIKVEDFDAVVFVGGPGCLKNLDNEDSYRVAREVAVKEKLLAAICISSVILAKAGVLKNKKATVWSAPMDKKGIEILKGNGAIYEDKPVVIDGRIITGNGPSAAQEFGRVIVGSLTGKSV